MTFYREGGVFGYVFFPRKRSGTVEKLGKRCSAKRTENNKKPLGVSEIDVALGNCAFGSVKQDVTVHDLGFSVVQRGNIIADRFFKSEQA